MSLAGGATATWVEAYGAVGIDPSADHEQATTALQKVIPVAQMAEAADFFSRVAHESPEILHEPDGWGRVEVEAGFLPHDDATPFGSATVDAEQQAWLAVAGGAVLPALLARSPQTGSAWTAIVQGSTPGPQRCLHLGYLEWANGKRESAQRHWRDALDFDDGFAMALHALTISSDDGEHACGFAERAHEADPEDDDLLVEYLRRARTDPGLVKAVIDGLDPARREVPRIRLAAASALVALGRLCEARDIIDTLELPNLREVSTELADVWAEYAEAAGIQDSLPEHLDFAMG